MSRKKRKDHEITLPEEDAKSESQVDKSSSTRLKQLESDVATINSQIQKLTQQVETLAGQKPDSEQSSRQIESEEASKAPFTLDMLLNVMIKHKASDLHLKPGNRPVVRLNGELVPVGEITLTAADTQKLILDAMPEVARQRFNEFGNVDFGYSLGEARFRINAFRRQSNVSAAIRLLRLDIPSFEALELPEILKKVSQLNNGLVLITGPAGNGKSTTLAAVVDHINTTQKKHIITIEDPIEYLHIDKESFINQREIGSDAPTFFEALKQALRQDPNVILIGEMRDPETIWTSVMAAETGHLVLSTLHTPNSIQAVDRIIDTFEGEQQRQFRHLLANTLRGVVSQRLLPRADGAGRVLAVEVMVVTPTISSLIEEGKTGEIYQYMVQGEHEGMQTFTESLTKLYQAGLITKEVALYHAEHPTEFKLGLEGHSSNPMAALDWSPKT